MLNFKVLNQTISRTDSFGVVADSRNYLNAKFDCSEEWTGDVFAIFGYDGRFYHQKLTNGICKVPWEVIKPPYFTVSLFCGDLITANVLTVEVEKSGMEDGEVPSTPTPTVFTEYLNELIQKNSLLAESIRFPVMSESEYESAEFEEDVLVIVLPDSAFEG